MTEVTEIDRLRGEIVKLRDNQLVYIKSHHELETTIAVMQKDIETIGENVGNIQKSLARVLWIIGGGFLASFVAWVLAGGMVIR